MVLKAAMSKLITDLFRPFGPLIDLSKEMGAQSTTNISLADPRINLGLLWLTLIPGLPYLGYLLRDVAFIYGLGAFAFIPVIYALLKKALYNYQIDGLEKRAIFITGCDSGFGNLLALKCAKNGMPGAEALRKAANGFPGKIETIIVNVASTESVADAAKQLDKLTEKYGGLHAVVNNAGVVGATSFDDLLSVEQYREVAEVNTFGVIRVTQALKHLVKKTRGRIVTMSSAAAIVGLSNWGPYTTSKHAVSGYCEVIRQELRLFGVSLHILEPGIFRTPMAEHNMIKARYDEVWRRAPERAKLEYGRDFVNTCSEKMCQDVEMVGSTRVDLVVDAYYHALTAQFPQLRYQVGNDCHYFYLPISYMPTGLRDAFFSLIEMLTGAPVPECAQRNGYQAPKKSM